MAALSAPKRTSLKLHDAFLNPPIMVPPLSFHSILARVHACGNLQLRLPPMLLAFIFFFQILIKKT